MKEVTQFIETIDRIEEGEDSNNLSIEQIMNQLENIATQIGKIDKLASNKQLVSSLEQLMKDEYDDELEAIYGAIDNLDDALNQIYSLSNFIEENHDDL